MPWCVSTARSGHAEGFFPKPHDRAPLDKQ